jgi:RimJ/RimL family protein N-acetyltransferase
MTIKELVTKRTTLKKLENEDSSFILELLNTAGWLKFIGDRNVQNREDALKYIEKINSDSAVTYWVVQLNGTGHKAGVITLIKRDHLEFHDIGFAFLPQFNSNGYAYEATNAVMNFLIESTGLKTILATTIPENTNSIKLIEKLGLSYYQSKRDDKKDLNIYSIDMDKRKIDEATSKFFSAFTNKQSKPNLALLHQCCLEEILIIKNTNAQCETYDLEGFISPRQELLTKGSLIDFEEYEVKEDTIITQNIAQRISHYQKEGKLNGQKFTTKGTKMLQFVKKDNQWQISSVIWDDA